MKFSSLISIFVVIIIVPLSKSDSLTHYDYVNLISEIYKWSESTSVAFLHFNQNDDLFQKNLIFQIQFLLLEKKILTSDINLEKLSSLADERIHNFKGLRKDDKAMSIFLLTSMNDLNVMKDFMRLLTRTKVIYFALFMKSQDSNLKELCLKPIGNPFGLNKGVSFLIKCQDNFMIREWLSIDGNKTEIHNRGIWNKETGFREISNERIVNDHDILSGKILYSIMSVEDDIQEKYFNRLIEYLEIGGNCTIKRYKSMTYYSVYNDSSTTWHNMIELFSNGTLDVGMGFFSYVPANLRDFDFSEPLAKIQFIFLIKRPSVDVHISFYAYFKPFTIYSWIAFTFVIIISLSIQIFTIYKLRTEKMNIGDEIFNIFIIVLHQSLPEFSKARASKIVQISISLFILIIMSLYTGSFVRKLTYSDPYLPFNSKYEYANVKSHRLIVFKYTANYNKLKNAKTYPWKEISKLQVDNSRLPHNASTAMDMVCNDNVALFTDELFLQMMLDNVIKTSCSYVAIATEEYYPVTFILQKNSPYTVTMRQIVKKLRNFGILTRMKREILRTDNFIFTKIPSFKRLTFDDSLLLIVILSGGIVFSIFTLILESIYSYCRMKIVRQ